MPDLVVSIFKLENERGYISPKISIQYIEKGLDTQWTINCGGTRAYLIRFGPDLNKDFGEQSADSHFMVSRITTGLFISGCGLFRAKSVGRLVIEDICFPEMKITTHLDLWTKDSNEQNDEAANDEFTDWYKFICDNVLFRRAIEDAYFALLSPVEVCFYLYRGMEWLLQAADIGWKELANYIGVSFNDIKKFKRHINFELGDRHGIKSGHKRRAIPGDYGPLVADYLFGLSNVRKRVDNSYPGMSPERAAEIVMKAMSFVPYP